MTAIVTGSSRGIGRGCALELARGGADVVVNYLSNRDAAEEVAGLIRQMGRRALVVPCNASNRDQVQAMIDLTVAEWGSLDIMIANSAQSVRKPMLELEPEDVAHTWNQTLWATFHSCQLAARQMVRQGRGGKICAIGSVHAKSPEDHALPYNTAKAGINHMMRTMASELTAHRINVNVVEPGWIDTPGERQFLSDQELIEQGKRLPWGRLGTAEEIGKAAAFICSRDAEYITGSVLNVDGGYLLPGWRSR